jgi:prepilin-type N-terminal cleavage/methylation domain-containing protein
MDRNQAGFTLIEIATVMVIIGLLAGGSVFLANSLIQGTHAKEIMAMATDLSVAVRQFKDRYHYFPGDLPEANPDITAVADGGVCDYSNTNDPSGTDIGDGEIDTDTITAKNTEVDCVADHLYNSGFIKSGIDGLRTRFGAIRIIVNSDSNFSAITLVGNPKHIIEFAQLPLEIAQEMDRSLDDGDITTGSMQGSAGDTTTDPVPFYAVPL